MKRLTLLAALMSLLAGPAAVAQEAITAALAAIADLGQLNGQALACEQVAIASAAKQLAIRHAPKTRAYGETFEEHTNTAFLAQGKKGQDPCPAASAFSARLDELSVRLQSLLPAAPATGQ